MYSPVHSRIATLLPLAKRRFAPFSNRRTLGNSVRMNSGEPSFDPLSDTKTSKSTSWVFA